MKDDVGLEKRLCKNDAYNSAKITLLDYSLLIFIKSICEFQNIYNNTIIFIRYFIIYNLHEIISCFISLLLKRKYSLKWIQFVLIYFITVSIITSVLGMNSGEKKVISFLFHSERKALLIYLH
jgi:magnesium-transporting ATPase (P-type)